MFKVTIQNIAEASRSWGASFPTEIKATTWLAKQKLKEGRRPERVEMQSVFNEQTQAMEEVEVVLPAEATYLVENLLLNNAYLLEQCHQNRAKAYPPMADYLDAIVKGDEAQRLAYIAACAAVKALYPKP